MKIDRILAGIREAQASEKQASEAPAAAPAAEKTASVSSTALVAALNEALASTEKTASAAPVASPTDDVMKVAQEIANAEKEAALKEAQILGAAFADSAIARLDEWNKTAAEMLVNGGTEKVSSSQLEEAALMGYKQAQADLEKEAEESYVKGYNDTVEAIHKTAAVEFLKAAAITEQIIAAAGGQR